MKELQIVDITKPKSIIIDGELHNQFRVLCKRKSLKIGGVIESLIRLYLYNPTKIDMLIDGSKDTSDIKS